MVTSLDKEISLIAGNCSIDVVEQYENIQWIGI